MSNGTAGANEAAMRLRCLTAPRSPDGPHTGGNRPDGGLTGARSRSRRILAQKAICFQFEPQVIRDRHREQLSAFSFASSAEREPTMTDATARWPHGNWIAAALMGTWWAEQITSILRARPMISGAALA